MSVIDLTEAGLEYLPSSLYDLSLLVSNETIRWNRLSNKIKNLELNYIAKEDGLKDLTHLNQLECLCLRYYKEVKGMDYLPESLLKLEIVSLTLNSTELGKLPKNLISLQLECQIDNIGIQNLFKSPCGGNLKELSLRHCKNITDNGFKNLPDNLVELNLFKCKKVSKRAIKHLKDKFLSEGKIFFYV